MLIEAMQSRFGKLKHRNVLAAIVKVATYVKLELYRYCNYCGIVW